ncbi:MAG: disulfide bond formation protein B [Pseudomonadota bacterium]|jgi:disulfide bond formation protein DsbB|nr:disulfide bond formation protein B [Pseudomonadota bacterium]
MHLSESFTPRIIFAGLGFICVGYIVVALLMEHQLGLEPCPLCILQRLAVILCGCTAFLAAIHAPRQQGINIYRRVFILTALIGSAISIRHLWLQSLPAEKVPACGPGLDYLLDVFPLTEVLSMVLSGDGSCAEVTWSFIGLTIPGWTLIAFLLLIAIAHYTIESTPKQ